MKAAPEAQMQLLDLAEVDAGLDRIAHNRRTLPELAEIKEITERADELEQNLVAAETEVKDAGRAQRKAEADVDQVRSRIERDQKRLDSGQVASPRDLENLQSEIESLRRRQDELEEVVLELMEGAEGAQERVTSLTGERDGLTTRREEAEARRDAALADLDKESGEEAGRRREIAEGLPQDLLQLYDKLREQHGGVGAAALRRGQCGGCKVTLALADLNALRTAPPNEVQRCEECRRILVRTPESGL